MMTSMTSLIENASAKVLEKAVGPTILIVDDEKSITDSLARMFTLQGYDPLCAANAQSALAMFSGHPIDLLILDINMPGRDGWWVLDRVRAIFPAVPVIVITALPLQENKAVTKEANVIMAKPLDMPVLLSAVENLLADDCQVRVRRAQEGRIPTYVVQTG